MMERSRMLVVVGVLSVLCGGLPVDGEFLHAGEVINRENIKTALGQLISDLSMPSISLSLSWLDARVHIRLQKAVFDFMWIPMCFWHLVTGWSWRGGMWAVLQTTTGLVSTLRLTMTSTASTQLWVHPSKSRSSESRNKPCSRWVYHGFPLHTATHTHTHAVC